LPPGHPATGALFSASPAPSNPALVIVEACGLHNVMIGGSIEGQADLSSKPCWRCPRKCSRRKRFLSATPAPLLGGRTGNAWPTSLPPGCSTASLSLIEIARCVFCWIRISAFSTKPPRACPHDEIERLASPYHGHQQSRRRVLRSSITPTDLRDLGDQVTCSISGRTSPRNDPEEIQPSTRRWSVLTSRLNPCSLRCAGGPATARFRVLLASTLPPSAPGRDLGLAWPTAPAIPRFCLRGCRISAVHCLQVSFDGPRHTPPAPAA